MRVHNILGENGQQVTEVQLDFNELTSLQIGALRAIAQGRVDFENVSDRMMEVLYDLQNYNLVDAEFELTPTGEKAIELATTLGGSSERRQARARNQVQPDMDDIEGEDVYDTDYGGADDEYEDNMSVYDHNRFGSVNQNN